MKYFLEFLGIGVSIVAVMMSFYLGKKSMLQQETNEVVNDATEMNSLNLKLEHISEGISELKSDMREFKNDTTSIRERVLVLEENQKEVYKILNKLEETT